MLLSRSNVPTGALPAALPPAHQSQPLPITAEHACLPPIKGQGKREGKDSHQQKQSTLTSHQSRGRGRTGKTRLTPIRTEDTCLQPIRGGKEKRLPPIRAEHNLPPTNHSMSAKIPTNHSRGRSSHQSQQCKHATHSKGYQFPTNPSGEQLSLTNHNREDTTPPPITVRGTTNPRDAPTTHKPLPTNQCSAGASRSQ